MPNAFACHYYKPVQAGRCIHQFPQTPLFQALIVRFHQVNIPATDQPLTHFAALKNQDESPFQAQAKLLNDPSLELFR